ncbi:MAG: type I-E CRISPR-associated protein Cas5/CasD [Flaviflexus sp.]|nr:type I-E CRISPR-associated protein Cas5/CasD [Flaviflexus sp.]
MREALYLRFAGPLQSWAGPRAAGFVTRTNHIPTRSGIEGFLAGIFGLPRGDFPEWFSLLEMSVRVDHPGTFCDDFQVVYPRYESLDFQQRLYQILTGKTRLAKPGEITPDSGNSRGGTQPAVLRRTYLAGAEFLVRIACDDHIDELNAAMCSPTFVSYLGKKAFAPTFPIYLGIGDSGKLKTLPAYVAPSQRRSPTPDREQDRDNYRVTIHHLDPFGGESRENAIAIPTVDSRDEWLKQVGAALTRRSIPQHLAH